MKAIQVNTGTFSKVSSKVTHENMEMIKGRYDSIITHDDEEMYVIINEPEPGRYVFSGTHSRETLFSNHVLVTSVGDWSKFPNDWFEIRYGGL